MTDDKSQFLYLLNCFLNGKTPKTRITIGREYTSFHQFII